jgi:hypothetical protein
MNLEKRIRTTAAKKVRVIITQRSRSRRGFRVVSPEGEVFTVASRREGLVKLLTKVRVADPAVWKLEACP